MDDLRNEILSGLLDGAPSNALRALDQTRVIVHSDHDQFPLTLSLVNLLSRLVPQVEVDVHGHAKVHVAPFGFDTPQNLVRSVVGRGRPPSQESPRHVLRIGVGAVDCNTSLHVSASEWSVRMSGNACEPLRGRGPATVAASALAAATALRMICSDLPGIRLGDEVYDWNLWNYRCELAPSDARLGRAEAVCFGSGSVGSSVVYALLVAECSGLLRLVDPDRLTPRNRLRYPALIDGSLDAKVDWVRRIAAQSSLRVEGVHGTVASYADNSPPIQLAVAAVDSADARRDVADALARETLNVGVDGDKFHVSRHRFNDGYACAYCGYLDVGSARDGAGVYADMTGLTVERAGLLLGGHTLEPADVDVLVSRRIVGRADAPDFVGARLVDLVRDRLYGEVVPIGANDPMPAPYVAALAGAIVAAELSKDDRDSNGLDRRIDVDCSGLPTGFQSRPPQDPTRRCLCWSDIRASAYARAWA